MCIQWAYFRVCGPHQSTLVMSIKGKNFVNAIMNLFVVHFRLSAPTFLEIISWWHISLGFIFMWNVKSLGNTMALWFWHGMLEYGELFPYPLQDENTTLLPRSLFHCQHKFAHIKTRYPQHHSALENIQCRFPIFHKSQHNWNPKTHLQSHNILQGTTLLLYEMHVELSVTRVKE